MFEPNPAEAALLRDAMAHRFASSLILETGLSNVVGTRDLNIAAFAGCTSLREPNPDVLDRYRIGGAFQIIRSEPIAVTRYDVLYAAGQVPPPDAIKIDVQGYEYEALQGFGGLLQDCLGIELEVHTYPVYRGQKLLHDMISFLADFGFKLRRLHHVPAFDGDVVELDAWFTKDARTWLTLDPLRREKFKLYCDVCDLIDYSRIKPGAHHNEIEPKWG